MIITLEAEGSTEFSFGGCQSGMYYIHQFASLLMGWILGGFDGHDRHEENGSQIRENEVVRKFELVQSQVEQTLLEK